MGTIKIEDSFKPLIHATLGCPVCRADWGRDRRYKKDTKCFPCHIYRASETSVTIECNSCKLRYMVTWRSLVKMFRRKADLTANKDHKELYERFIKRLYYEVDADYSTRKPPEKSSQEHSL